MMLFVTRSLKEKSPVSSGQPLKKKKLENPTRQYKGTANTRVIIYSSGISIGNSEELNHEKQNATGKKIIKGTYDEAANKLTENILQSGHQVRLSEAFPSGKIHVPLNFMAKCSNQSTTNVTLQVKNRQWNVKLISYASRGILSAGRPAFAHNNVQAGDVCIFELINAAKGLDFEETW
ncbi:conserved hypothetical protein [Ricinus communis]|uniref:TF-B3 domain-containing protein n=1 Tax=Ricinus communis TaxID=3988 RepID=B9RTD3_RICCO|nr:conserved hypothetical protein [Ricinus communis]